MSAAWTDGERFTSLFGSRGLAAVLGLGRIGADEVYDCAIEGESGPTLDVDLTLPCRDNGRRRIESFLIQDPVDEMESLGPSGVGDAEASRCINSDRLSAIPLGDVAYCCDGLW
jgi:hypothetical protein